MLELAHSLLQDNTVYGIRTEATGYHTLPAATYFAELADDRLHPIEELFEPLDFDLPYELETFTALSQLLDLIICNDELVYDSEMSWVWDSTETMDAISPLMKKIRLGEKTKLKLTAMWEYSSSAYPRIIWEGALYYLGLSQLLGVNYWPSPRRAQFLLKTFYDFRFGFVSLSKEMIDSGVQKLAREIFEKFQSTPNLWFPGYGSTILSQCTNRHEILPIAIQFRNTKECIAFRNWLHVMNLALESGDLEQISRGLNDVQDVIDYVYKGLGIKKPLDSNIELEIGLSPSIKFDKRSITDFADWITPKPYHIVFLRRHMMEIVRNTNWQKQISRLFPEVRVRLQLK
jgi:hypothetical protein